MLSCVVSTSFSVTEISPRRDSAKCQLLLLLLLLLMMMMNCVCGMVDRRKAFSLISSRDSFTKTLEALHVLIYYTILEERRKTLLKMFLIDVNRLTLSRRPQNLIETSLWSIFFKVSFYLVVFSILTIVRLIDM